MHVKALSDKPPAAGAGAQRSCAISGVETSMTAELRPATAGQAGQPPVALRVLRWYIVGHVNADNGSSGQNLLCGWKMFARSKTN